MAKRWYIIHAYSNFEKKVAESVQERASLSGIRRPYRRNNCTY